MSWLGSLFTRGASMLGKIAEKLPFFRPVGQFLSSNVIRPILSGLGVKAVDYAQERATEAISNLADSFRNRMSNTQIKPPVSQTVAIYNPNTDVARYVAKRNAPFALEDDPQKRLHTPTADDFPNMDYYRDEPD